ncbi:MAG: pyruvate, phosphate dikinase, partial [Candidatus Omnitrophica bacterium]|nr:pyruvate, phosphate dikinase [Candidatus Omnitrophota bacterium]
LVNAQGEDVVAGIRTPQPLTDAAADGSAAPSMEATMPAVYAELVRVFGVLERHYRDMQDIEFTIEKGRLFMLQCRVGKRNGPAAMRMAMDMVREKMISRETAITRVTPAQLDELLHPIIDPAAERARKPIAKGLPAGPGGANGQIVFSANEAVAWAGRNKKVILVREETNPEDVEGMRAAQAILTARGGMTSHAALVARGWGKCCVVGCGALDIDYETRELRVDGKVLKEGDWITLNGTKGNIYDAKLDMMDPGEENTLLIDFLKICGKIKKLGIRTNADTPEDARKARQFGAEGIGLFRTEHMFYGKGADQPLFLLRKMIMSKTIEERQRALDELFPFVKKDVKGTLEAMDGFPVVFRLLDPPLHEFVPREEAKMQQLAGELNIGMDELQQRSAALHESNPMMGHRGVRLGVTYPEVSAMQIRAIFEAAAELVKAGRKPYPEIMIPVVCETRELDNQMQLARAVYKEVLKKFRIKKIKHMFGTMIEIPRATLVADRLAEVAQFFSFGTNDLTQMGFGFSRDDIGGFLPDYLQKGILPEDPFQSLDQSGIGELVKIGIKRGRQTRKALEVGICGEHGGDPRSVEFCYKAGMDYVSCSPFRVPIAKLAAAQAALPDAGKAKGKKKKKKR